MYYKGSLSPLLLLQLIGGKVDWNLVSVITIVSKSCPRRLRRFFSSSKCSDREAYIQMKKGKMKILGIKCRKFCRGFVWKYLSMGSFKTCTLRRYECNDIRMLPCCFIIMRRDLSYERGGAFMPKGTSLTHLVQNHLSGDICTSH